MKQYENVIKKIVNKNNIIKIICYGLFLLIALYVVPQLLFSLYNIFLGNNREGFEWTEYQKIEFIKMESTTNPEIVYDLEQLQKYVSPEEIDSFLKTGYWPWSQEVVNLYMKALDKNPFIRKYKDASVKKARKVYNQSAILYILNAQSEAEEKYDKEKNGPPIQKVPSGWGDYGYNSGLIK